MSDLISREEVLRTIITAGEVEPDLGYTHLHKVIENLPSAVCDDCIWHVCNYNKVDWDGEDGYISKRDALAEFRDGRDVYDIMESIEELPSAEPKTGWIPVSERLPDKEERILVTVWGDVDVAWRDKYGIWESDEYMYEKDDITAWMPLPEPYKGGREK